MTPAQMIEHDFFGHGAPDFVAALCKHRLQTLAELGCGAILIDVDGLFDRAVAVVDDPTAGLAGGENVAEGIVFAEERRGVFVDQRTAVEPIALVCGSIDSLSDTHRAQIAELAAGIENVWGHIAVAAGGTIQRHRRVNGLL